MEPKKTGVCYSRSRQLCVGSCRLTILVLLLALVLEVGALSGCAAYTSVSTQSTGSKSLSASPSNVSFGSVSVGSTSTQSVTLTNSGSASVTVSQATVSGTAFTVTKGTPLSSIAPGQSATLQIQFAPSSSGNLTGSFTVASDATNSPTTVYLAGTGGATSQLTASPGSLSFGNVNVGVSPSLGITLTNSGNSNVTISSVNTSGAGYSASGVGSNTTLTPGQTTTLNVTFAPTAAGSVTGSVSVASNASNSPTTIALTGAGVSATSQLTASPSSLSFGNVNVGVSPSLGITLTNGGNSNVTISSVNTSGAGYSASGVGSNTTLTPGQTTTLNVTFAPTAAGSVTGSVSVASNASNSPTTIALTGAGVSATSQLTASPSSLSFGNVNVGVSPSLGITLTNGGNSNVTISSVNTSGAGYSASGVGSSATLTPGQTATLNVTFAPTAAGSVTGSVSVASNASNSPATISLSGSGVTQSASGAPICGISGDTSTHVPSDWTGFTPPAVSQSYVDSLFGCTVTRLTNGSGETLADGTHPGLMNFYSTLTAMNASDTLVFITYNNGSWRISDLHGNTVVSAANMPSMNGHAVWDAANGSVFYYASNNTLYKGTISGSSVTPTALHSFSEYSGIVLPDAGDLSQDGDHLALMGQNSNNTMDVFVLSLGQQTKTSVYTTMCTISGSITSTGQPGCVHKLLLSADNLLSIGFAQNGTGTEQGVRLWNGSSLIHLQDSMTSHYDHGYDMNGSPITTGRDNPSSLASFTNPCPSGWGLDVRQQGNFTSSCLLDNQPEWHISYRGSASQPWIAISFFDTRTPGPEYFTSDANYQTPSSSNWQRYEDEIILARVDANNANSNNTGIYRLALARSRSQESYWAQPHATISRDGNYVVFTSNMAYPNGCPANMHVPNECSDVYFIQVK